MINARDKQLYVKTALQYYYLKDGVNISEVWRSFHDTLTRLYRANPNEVLAADLINYLHSRNPLLEYERST